MIGDAPIVDIYLGYLNHRPDSFVGMPDPDVLGTFRGELKDVTLRQALEMILQTAGLRLLGAGQSDSRIQAPVRDPPLRFELCRHAPHRVAYGLGVEWLDRVR